MITHSDLMAIKGQLEGHSISSRDIESTLNKLGITEDPDDVAAALSDHHFECCYECGYWGDCYTFTPGGDPICYECTVL